MIVLDTLLAAAGSAAALVAYLACVALATTAQTLTGFAFGLIFLSLMAALDLASVADAANVATVLTLVNALTYLRAHRQAPPWRLMKPALASSSVGVVAGCWFFDHGPGSLLGLAIVASRAGARPRADRHSLARACGVGVMFRTIRPATTSIASRSRPRWCAAACC
ncbi:MAG: sulfite exporter TauE/SafE family protein [Rubrivivax sp.]|nr:sulfite exporter TauE/SafE family protein [Rubrivivax sp.]